MSVFPKESPRRVQQIIARVGNLLEWPLADRCLLTSTLVFLFAAQWLYVLSGLVEHPANAPYFDSFFIGKIQFGQQVFVGLWALLVATVTIFRRRFADAPAWGHLVAQLFAIHTGLVSYAFGSQTTPYGMLFGIAGGVGGVLILGIRTTLLGGITFTLIESGSSIGSMLGLVRYAPAMAAAPFTQGRLSLSWAQLTGSWTYVGQLLIVILVGYIIWRWRLREEQLREAHLLLREQKDKLVRVESLASIGSLVAGAAHELRNPLGSAGALLQSLRDDVAASHATDVEKDELFQMTEMALKGHARAATIAERLYSLTDEFATRGSIARLGDVLDALESRYEGLQIENSEELRDVSVPQSIFKVIIPNLLDNAYAAKGAEPPHLKISRSNGLWRFEVSDSGSGIPETLQSEVFKPFVAGQKSGDGHGVGLGLYIVHELASRMGGDVQLCSKVGEGTRVAVSILDAVMASSSDRP